MTNAQYQPMIEVRRGPLVESLHRGALAVVDSAGRLRYSLGDPDAVVYLRSSAKPFQALALIEQGGAEAFHLDEREIALMCASHSGSDQHVAILQQMQLKISVGEADLLCGTQPPLDEAALLELARRGESPTPNRHECSGKHTGMLALARFHNWPLAAYIDPQHPVQQLILKTVAEMCDVPPSSVILGVDGCSAPVFAVPLRQAALAYARLADPTALPEQRAAACRRIFQAMTRFPEMVAGQNRFDTCLMQAAAGQIVCKVGAEGYHGLGLLPGTTAANAPALGIALKIADGDLKGRAGSTAVMAVLRQLHALSPAQLDALAGFADRPVTNWREMAVGEVRATFKLETP